MWSASGEHDPKQLLAGSVGSTFPSVESYLSRVEGREGGE